jgi:hypothetical protein
MTCCGCGASCTQRHVAAVVVTIQRHSCCNCGITVVVPAGQRHVAAVGATVQRHVAAMVLTVQRHRLQLRC